MGGGGGGGGGGGKGGGGEGGGGGGGGGGGSGKGGGWGALARDGVTEGAWNSLRDRGALLRAQQYESVDRSCDDRPCDAEYRQAEIICRRQEQRQAAGDSVAEEAAAKRANVPSSRAHGPESPACVATLNERYPASPKISPTPSPVAMPVAPKARTSKRPSNRPIVAYARRACAIKRGWLTNINRTIKICAGAATAAAVTASATINEDLTSI